MRFHVGNQLFTLTQASSTLQFNKPSISKPLSPNVYELWPLDNCLILLLLDD